MVISKGGLQGGPKQSYKPKEEHCYSLLQEPKLLIVRILTDAYDLLTIAGHGLKLNLKQREAVRAITAPLSLALPPVLIIG